MWELQEHIETMVNQYFEDSSAVSVSAEAIGLDDRSGRVFVSIGERWIASSNPRALEYYGGFEYIGNDYKVNVGEITFYSADHSRVSDALERYITIQNN